MSVTLSWRRMFPTLLLLLFVYPAWADELKIFDLKGATPQELIPLVKPFVGADGSVTGMHNQLIVRTSAERMAEVNRIVQTFDKAPRRVAIQVRDTAPSAEERSSAGVSIDTPRVRIGEGDGNRLAFRRYSTETRETNVRTAQGVEGQPIFIASGLLRPEPTRSVVIGPGGRYQSGYGTEYHNIESGFYATVSLVGDRVRIEIATRKQSPRPGSPEIRHRATDSVVSGRLGEWLPLAGVETRQQTETQGIGAYASGGETQNESLWVRVEALPD